VKTIATCLGVARSHLHDRLRRTGEPPPKPHKAEDAAVLQLIRQLVEERPTYGYRRITALLRRQMARENGPAINHKRVFRIMRQHGLLLARHTAERPGRTHDGKVIVMRSTCDGAPMALSSPAGTATSCAWPSPSMHTIARSSPGEPSPAAASQAI
jgi:putative transposase